MYTNQDVRMCAKYNPIKWSGETGTMGTGVNVSITTGTKYEPAEPLGGT